MNRMIDYEYEAMQKKEAEQVAIKAAERRALRAQLLGILGYLVLSTMVFFGMARFEQWLRDDHDPAPAGLLLESEYRELVAGYPLLAEAFEGSYTDETDNMLRGWIDFYEDADGDGTAELHGEFILKGDYKAPDGVYGYYRINVPEDVGITCEPQEPETFEVVCRVEHYGLDELFKGRALAERSVAVHAEDHTASLWIEVNEPSKDRAEARAFIEEMLRIVRGE